MNKEEKIKKNKEEIKIIQEIIAGEKSKFEIIQKRYSRIIAALIRKMIKDEDDVQDLTQETFIKAYNGLERFQTNYSFSSWLFKIASNTCIDFLRKKRFNVISLNQPHFNDDEEQEIEIFDDSYTPDMELIAKERQKALLDAINELPDNYKEIIRLRHGENLDYAEIANRLNIPLGTVKAHIFRARKILYVKLKKHRNIFQDD